METNAGTLLGGRVRYAQPRDGYRTGIEPVLLAASVPARAGERVLEAGVGAGAGLLCLAARVAGVEGVGVEVDPAMAELARENIAQNGFDGLGVVTGDVTTVELPMADHVMANPPWHDPRSTPSPVDRRRVAKQESGPGIEAWAAALGRVVREGGTLTMIVPPALCERWAAGCARAGLRAVVRHMLVPKVGRAAKLVLVRAIRGPTTLTPALSRQRERGSNGSDVLQLTTVLHEADGEFTPAIDAVLRHGAALVIGEG